MLLEKSFILKQNDKSIYFYTNQRARLVGLKWTHIDRKDGFIRLPEDITKEGGAKKIPINHHMKAMLDSFPININHGFAVTFNCKPIKTAGGVKSSFKTACKNAGIPHGTKTKNGLIFLDIRRTVKTNIAAAGVSKIYRDTILGHSLQGMDAHYMKPSEKDLKEDMEKYTSWLDSEISNLDHSLDHEVIMAS